MTMIKGVGDFFGLDIGTTGVRVVQLEASGSGWALRHYAYAPVDVKISLADSAEAKQRLGEIIMMVVGQSGIKTRNVAINLPSSKSFITVIDMPNGTPAEIETNIKYQLDQYIPIAVEEAKVDWSLLGQSPHDPSQQEVLLASTSINYAEDRMELVESLGFDVIAAEPDSIAMIRSVLTPGAKNAQVIIDMGEQSINVAITYGDVPRLVRVIPNGLGTLVRAVVQNMGVDETQARQFVLKFGLAQDKLEGKLPQALEATLDGFVSELTKSIKFFQTRYPAIPIGNILLVGYFASVPQMAEYIANKTNTQTTIANPWRAVAIPKNDQNVAAIASEFAVAIGLAERRVDS